MNYFLYLPLLKENTVSSYAEVSDSCSIHDTCKHSVVRHHYISFKWYGPVKLEGVVTEPGSVVSQPSTRTEPAGPSCCTESRLRWEMDFAFWKSTVVTLNPRTHLLDKSVEGFRNYLLAQIYNAYFPKLLLEQVKS